MNDFILFYFIISSSYLNGDVYSGEWSNGMKNGKGCERYSQNSGATKESTMEARPKSPSHAASNESAQIYDESYEGMWKNNSKHGFGVYRYLSGDVYEVNMIYIQFSK